jgi:PKD repeat protein
MRQPTRPPDRDSLSRQRPPRGRREVERENGESGGRWTLARDDRAVSVAVSYVLALGITAILISGLLVASTDYLEDERQRATIQELDGLGNRLAAAFTDADRLSRSGGATSLTVERPSRIAGSDYTVEIRRGPICATPSEADCLHLQTATDNVSITIPLANRSQVALSRGDGHWEVSSPATGTEGDSPLGTDVEVRPNIGIGQGVEGSSEGDTVDPRNRDPISGFTFSPGYPTLGETVKFRNDTKDLDGEIVAYEWDVFDDGTVDATGPRLNYTFPRPGKYEVRLMVEDNNGATANVTKAVSVSGLVYENDAAAVDLDGDGNEDEVTFTVRNRFDDSTDGIDYDNATLLNVLIDPEDDGIDELREPNNGYEEEIVVDASRDGVRDLDNGVETIVPPGGIIVELRDGSDPFPRVAGEGGTGEFQLTSFDRDMNGEPVDIVLRYRVNGTRYTSEFTLAPGIVTNDAPTAAFDFTPDPAIADESVTFDAGGATDTDGSIVSYAWDFDGDGAVDATGETATTTFDDPGTESVTLTVTDNNGATETVTETVDVENQAADTGDVLYRVNAGGSEVAATDDGPDWSADTDSSPSEYLNGGDAGLSTYSTGDSVTLDSSVPSSTPTSVFQTERFDSTEGTEMEWTFSNEIESGETYEVRLYFAEIFLDASNVGSQGPRTFDVVVEGDRKLNDYDIYDRYGHDEGAVESFEVTPSDGSIEVRFPHEQENPKLSAIEIVNVSSTPPSPADPEASFDYTPTMPDRDETVTFDGGDSTAPAGSITDYEWTFPDGTTVSGADRETIDWSFDSPGAKDVTLTVTDSNGRTDSVTEQIVVTGGGPPSPQIGFQPHSVPVGHVAATDEPHGARNTGRTSDWTTQKSDDPVTIELTAGEADEGPSVATDVGPSRRVMGDA